MDLVNDVTGFQGIYSADTIREGLFDSIMWPFLGKLKAPTWKVQAMNNRGIKPFKQRAKDETDTNSIDNR